MRRTFLDLTVSYASGIHLHAEDRFAFVKGKADDSDAVVALGASIIERLSDRPDLHVTITAKETPA